MLEISPQDLRRSRLKHYRATYVAKRLHRGVCTHCDEAVQPDRMLCPSHLASLRANTARIRAERGAKGTCYRCSNPARPGGLLCQQHRDEVREKERTHAISCLTCGKFTGHRYCEEHRTAGFRQEREARLRNSTVVPSLCFHCGIWGHGVNACRKYLLLPPRAFSRDPSITVTPRSPQRTGCVICSKRHPIRRCPLLINEERVSHITIPEWLTVGTLLVWNDSKVLLRNSKGTPPNLHVTRKACVRVTAINADKITVSAEEAPGETFDLYGECWVACLDKLPEPPPMTVSEDIGSTPVWSLNLCTWTQTPLNKAGILSVKDLLEKTADELWALPRFGRRSLKEVRRELANLGVALRGELIETPSAL